MRRACTVVVCDVLGAKLVRATAAGVDVVAYRDVLTDEEADE